MTTATRGTPRLEWVQARAWTIRRSAAARSTRLFRGRRVPERHVLLLPGYRVRYLRAERGRRSDVRAGGADLRSAHLRRSARPYQGGAGWHGVCAERDLLRPDKPARAGGRRLRG